jgi:hypothetical protein
VRGLCVGCMQACRGVHQCHGCWANLPLPQGCSGWEWPGLRVLGCLNPPYVGTCSHTSGVARSAPHLPIHLRLVCSRACNGPSPSSRPVPQLAGACLPDSLQGWLQSPRLLLDSSSGPVAALPSLAVVSCACCLGEPYRDGPCGPRGPKCRR